MIVLATLTTSCFAGRNRSAIPLGSVEELWEYLGDLAMNHTPVTAATRLGSSTAGRGATTGSSRSGSMFLVVGRQKKLRLDDAWHLQDEEKEYEHIMTILDRQGGFGQNHSNPAFYVRFPTLKERRAARDKFARKRLTCGEDAHFARDCPKPFMNVSTQITSDVGSGNATETEINWRI